VSSAVDAAAFTSYDDTSDEDITTLTPHDDAPDEDIATLTPHDDAPDEDIATLTPHDDASDEDTTTLTPHDDASTVDAATLVLPDASSVVDVTAPGPQISSCIFRSDAATDFNFTRPVIPIRSAADSNGSTLGSGSFILKSGTLPFTKSKFMMQKTLVTGIGGKLLYDNIERDFAL
jgi:hypothetical protein